MGDGDSDASAWQAFREDQVEVTHSEGPSSNTASASWDSVSSSEEGGIPGPEFLDPPRNSVLALWETEGGLWGLPFI